MRNLLYPKLALTNLAKNKSTYFPYMLTGTVCVMTNYSVLFIATNEGMSQVPGGPIALTMFFLGTLVVGIFNILVMFYTNSFLIRRRKKELGLYCVLGMEKRHVALVLLCEIFFTAVLCLVLGLLFGILFSRLMFLSLLYLLGFETPFAFSISMRCIVSTVVFFLCIYGATLLYDLRSVRMANPTELLQGRQRGEKEPKASWLLTLIGLVTLGGGYFIAVYFQSPTEAILLFFVAVVLVIIGTFCLFTSGSIAFLKLLRRNRRFYYQPNNFIAVSGMMYRMKQNASGLAAICILSTMVLVTVSSTVCLYAGRTDMVHSMFPREISASFFIGEDQEMAAQFEDASAQALSELGLAAENRTMCRSLSSNVLYRDGVYRNAADAAELRDTTISLVNLSDYNAIDGVSPTTLAPDEAIVYPVGNVAVPETLNLGGNVVRVAQVLEKTVFCDVGTYDGAQGFVLVVPDDRQAPLYCALTGVEEALVQTSYYYAAGFDVPGASAQQCAALAHRMQELFPDHTIRCRSAIAAEWDAMYGCFLFLGIFLGSLFLLATMLIIYYKQISEGYEDHDRFVVMQQVGMSTKEVQRAISKQILLVFFLPLGAAALHMAFAFPIIRNILLVFSLNNVGLFLACTGGTFLIFALVYVIVYRITARIYYRLVEV